MRHELKIHPEYFASIIDGEKTFEVRKDDRGFNVWDELDLREWNPQTLLYTGWSTIRTVTYILKGPHLGIENGWCVMSLSQSR